MKKAARRATTSFSRHGQFLCPGNVADYKPNWFNDHKGSKDVTEVGDLKTHAHWCAAWWARGLSQLAAQGHAEKQTLSMADLVTQFLNINKIAIERSTKVAWTYDKDQWHSLSDRVKRYESVNVQAKLLEVDNNKLAGIAERLEEARKDAAKERAQTAAKDTKDMRRPDSKGPWKDDGKLACPIMALLSSC